MAMAARKIVAEPLTITGSIGVITGKFNLAELYRRAGYAKTSISKGRQVECLQDAHVASVEGTAVRSLGTHQRAWQIRHACRFAWGCTWFALSVTPACSAQSPDAAAIRRIPAASLATTVTDTLHSAWRVVANWPRNSLHSAYDMCHAFNFAP